jgi:adenosylcobinamide kinase/adenosylcobinamide-phosphate guanylyltransferase
MALLAALPGTQILVGNEVGLGVMPMNELARRYADVAGTVHQRLAAICDHVILMVAGLPMMVKSPEGAEQAPHRSRQ